MRAYYSADVHDRVNTFIVGVDQVLIPKMLDLKLGYTLSLGQDTQPLSAYSGLALPTALTGGQYPEVKTNYQRFDASARYRFDDGVMRSAGLQGEAYLKLRYAWERNSVANWQTDNMKTYMYSASPAASLISTGYMTWLAQDNPNYNVHLIAASFGYKW